MITYLNLVLHLILSYYELKVDLLPKVQLKEEKVTLRSQTYINVIMMMTVVVFMQ